MTKTSLVLTETGAKVGVPSIAFPFVQSLVMQIALLLFCEVIASCSVLLVMRMAVLLKMTKVATQNSLSIVALHNPWKASVLVLGLMPAASTVLDAVQL